MLRFFELDDVGAHVGQHHGAERPRNHPREIQDANSVQRRNGRRCAFSSRRIGPRWIPASARPPDWRPLVREGPSRSVAALPMIVTSSASSCESRPDANEPASRDG
jgi:hypothetical protein